MIEQPAEPASISAKISKLPAMLKKKARPVVIFTTTPDMITAEKLAYLLVENRLAACVNIIPEIQAVYKWEGKLTHERETKLMIKTSSACADRTRKFIKANHPYKVPEITTFGAKGDVAMDVNYWAWVEANVK